MIKKCFKNELNSQFRARSGQIRLDPVIRSDPVNTWTAILALSFLHSNCEDLQELLEAYL